ncbi:MAG: alpha/beta hydrolase [Chloroflexota bacterium]
MTQGFPRREIDIPARHGRLHCVVQGEGNPLVLLHGALGTGLAHFRGQIDEFAQGYQVIVPDFLGYGKSGRRASFDEYFYQRDMEDVVAMVQHLGLPPVHLCGFSDGAVVAMMVAGEHGACVRSLVLIGGQAVLDDQAMEVVRTWTPVERLPMGLQQALAHSHGDPYWRQLVTEYVDALERLYHRGGDVASECLPNIACPTLIIQGERDPWVNAVHAQMLHSSIRESELELFPGTGHEVHREKPEAFNRRVLSFLSSLYL